jgi:prolyl-tRNA synthetase
VKEKQAMATNEFVSRASEILGSIQQNLYQRALKFRDANTRTIDSKEEFYAFFTPKNPGETGNSRWLCFGALERLARNRGKSKKRPQSHYRCIPSSSSESGRCIFTGQASAKRVVWAKAY